MEKEIVDMEELTEKITNPVFIIYVNAAVIVSVILLYHFLPKYPGLKNIMMKHLFYKTKV